MKLKSSSDPINSGSSLLREGPTDRHRTTNRWFRLYYLLAGFCVLTALAALYLNHQAIKARERSVLANRQWVERLNNLSELSQLAAEVDRPGNEVFETQDPTAQRARVQQALERFEHRWRAVEQELRARLLPPDHALLLPALQIGRERIIETAQQAGNIFASLEQNDSAAAGRHMAAMDRHYGRALEAFEQARAALRNFMLRELEAEAQRAYNQRRLKYGTALLTVVLVLAILGYGHWLAREMESGALEKAQRSRQLSEAEERFRLLVDSVKDYAIYLLDATGQVITWNKGAERIKGYTAAEVIGQPYALFFSPEECATGRPGQELEEAATTGRLEAEGWRIRKDGTRFWAHTVITPLYDQTEQLRGFSKVTRDMSERRRAEQLLRSVVDNTLDGIISIDERGVVQSFNKSAEKIFGYRAEEVISQKINMLMPEPYTSEHDQYLGNYLRTGHAKIIGIGREVSGRRKDGSTFPMELAVSEFELDRRRHFTGIVRDISERKKLEGQLRQSQKMEAIGQLAGGVAHDFNNILGAIIGFTELIKDDAAGQPVILDNLEAVSKASHRAADLVKQILTFSRQNEQERLPTQLGLVIKEALKLLRATVPVTIEFKSQLLEVPTVLAAPTQIHQVIMNLGTNAWHAMRDQAGVLDVTLAPLQVDFELARLHPELRPGPYVKLSISDTGCGMSRATLERIFDPFFTTKGPGEGTGLGLAVVHGIMKSHDGTITVYSEPGKGTVFHLYFPVFEADPVQSPAEQTAIPQGHGVRVLFVDDEEPLTRVGRTMLERLGYHVTTQTSPLQALELFRAHPQDFDLVLTDYTMPGMTGLQLTRQLLTLRADIPVILTTGYSAMLTPESLQDAGLRELVLKPYNTRILGEAFHQVLSRAGRARPT